MWAVVAHREVKMMVDGGQGGASSSREVVGLEALDPGPERSRLREEEAEEVDAEGLGRFGFARRRWRMDLGGLRRR